MAKNVRVVAKRDSNGQLESVEVLLRKFKKEVIKSCVLEDCKKKEYFRTKKEIRIFKHDMLMRHIKNKKYKIVTQSNNAE